MDTMVYDVMIGEHISYACREIVALANERNMAVTAEFNGVTLIATPGADPQAIEDAKEEADAIIRLLDIGASLGLDVGVALVTKVEKNKERPAKHGKASPA